ncbi:MAG: hypothetical protein MMC33_004482 [Icmadophila ericetorum]|nr:hypothetical protein [Icmadophila ericetorum]
MVAGKHEDMEQRALIPPGLPRSNPTESYWQYQSSSLSTHRTTTRLPSSVSVVIIGSGITGAFIAYNILSRGSPQSIVMLEARTVCNGATGRNGGHTKCASYRSFLYNLQTLGEAEAVKTARFEYNCMKAVHTFAREKHIQCDSWEGDTVDVMYDEDQWEEANRAAKEMKRLMGDKDPAAAYKFWSEKETEEKFLTKGAFGAVTYAAGSINAYKFVSGVLDLAVKMGLNLQTETPALSIKKIGQGWIVETPRGTIEAQRVVLATNGYTAHLYPALQGKIVPLRGEVTAHRPGSSIPKAGLPTTYSFIYEDGYDYMIPRPRGSGFEGDIIIGGGLTKGDKKGLYEYGTTDDTTTDSAIMSYLDNSTLTYFGANWGNDHPKGRIRKAWSGIMGYSADGFPLIGKAPGEEGLFIAASFQGHGMVLCLSSAKALVHIMYCEDEQALDQWFPKAFRITEERLNHRFQGRLHTIVSKDL